MLFSAAAFIQNLPKINRFYFLPGTGKRALNRQWTRGHRRHIIVLLFSVDGVNSKPGLSTCVGASRLRKNHHHKTGRS